MKIYSVIRAKIRRDAKNTYFYTLDEKDSRAVVSSLYEADWNEAEVRRIKKRDKDLEGEIFDCCVGSEEEQKRLRKYFKKQKPF